MAFSLKIPSNKQAAKRNAPSKQPLQPSKNIFGDDDDDEDSNDNGNRIKAKSTNGKQERAAHVLQASREEVNSQIQESKKKLNFDYDPAIFGYDEVYDDMKAGDRIRAEQRKKDQVERKPKYMDTIMASAKIRQRDQLIAEEKKLQREREEEGDLYADKEKFVTSAYKKQQEENRRIEEEEKDKEGMRPSLY